jgi:FLVCR family feline leukemia virus subgroup C receptor-related protein
MRICFLIGGILVSGGVWLRLLIEIDHAVFCLVGSAFAAVGNIFILNTPSKIAFNWFRTEKGSLVIFAGVIATMFSISLGSAIPGLILGQNSTQDEIKNFLLIEAIVITVPYILLVIFFREKPVIPPSKAAMAVSTEKKASYLILMRKLFTNIEYIKLIVSISLSYGSLTAFITIMDQCLKDLGYSNSG